MGRCESETLVMVSVESTGTMGFAHRCSDLRASVGVRCGRVDLGVDRVDRAFQMVRRQVKGGIWKKVQNAFLLEARPQKLRRDPMKGEKWITSRKQRRH